MTEGPYTKLIALGTFLLVVLSYFAVAYPAHWIPFSSDSTSTVTALPSVSVSTFPSPVPTSTSPSLAPASTSPSVPSTSASPTLGPAETGVPLAYQGSWEGGLTYEGEANYVNMSLNQGSVGTQVGQYVNDTLHCQASVYLEGGNGPIYLRLVLTSNPENVCVPFVYAQANITSSGLYFVLEDTSEVWPNEPTSDGFQLSGTLGKSTKLY
jgi:hypothetical protein